MASSGFFFWTSAAKEAPLLPWLAASLKEGCFDFWKRGVKRKEEVREREEKKNGRRFFLIRRQRRDKSFFAAEIETRSLQQPIPPLFPHTTSRTHVSTVSLPSAGRAGSAAAFGPAAGAALAASREPAASSSWCPSPPRCCSFAAAATSGGPNWP